MLSSSMIGQIAATNPYVGAALSTANEDTSLLLGLAQTSSSGADSGLYGALGMLSMGQTLMPPVTAAAALQSSSAFSSSLTTPESEGQVDLAAEQAAPAASLLSSLTGLGQNVDLYA